MHDLRQVSPASTYSETYSGDWRGRLAGSGFEQDDPSWHSRRRRTSHGASSRPEHRVRSGTEGPETRTQPEQRLIHRVYTVFNAHARSTESRRIRQRKQNLPPRGGLMILPLLAPAFAAGTGSLLRL